MNISVIGSGSVGSTLAIALSKAGHAVVFGVRNPNAEFKGKDKAIKEGIKWYAIPDAVKQSDVILLCAPGHMAHEVARQLGNVAGKIIIDTMNAVGQKPANYNNTSEAILANCNATDLAKCFNTTGAENMGNPNYNGQAIDMYIAGTSERAKAAATQLAKDIGFGNIYDFGGAGKFDLLEQFALCWINLAIMQKQGRNIAFNILRRVDR